MHFRRHPLLQGLLLLLLLSAVTLSFQLIPATAQTSVKLGYIDFDDSLSPDLLALTKGITLGTQAAVARANKEGGVHDRPLELVKAFTNFDENDYPVQMQNILNAHPDVVAMVNMLGNNHINMVKPLLKQHNLPNLGPMVSDPLARGYDPQTFFIRPDPWAEIVAIVNQAVSKFRIKRIGFMWTKNYAYDPETGAPYGETHRKVFYSLMEQLGLEVVAEFVYDYDYTKGNSTFNPLGAAGEFLLKKPDAVFMFAGVDQTAVEFIIYCLAHPLAGRLAPNLKFFVTEALAILAGVSFIEAKKMFPTEMKDITPKDRVYSTFTFPLTTDTSYAIVREYHQDMTALFGTAYHQLVGYTTIAGYISTRFAIETLRRAPRPLTPEGVTKTLHASSIWEVSDVSYGIFKGDCKRGEEKFCRCNEGAHVIDIGVMDETYQWQKVPNASYSWDYTQCSGLDIKLRSPTNYLQMFDESNAEETALAALLRLGKEGAESTSSLNPKVGDIAVRAPGSDAKATVTELNNSLLVTTIAHSVLGERAMDEASLPWPLIDPFVPKAALALPFRQKVLHIHATLQQEFHAFAAHAAQLGATEILLVANPTVVEAMMVPFEKSATTFRIGSRSLSSLNEATDGSYVVVVGVSSATDVTSVVNELKAKPALRVGVAAAEFHAHYTAFTIETPAQVQPRLLTATNLPLWGAGGAGSSTLIKDYHTSIGGAANAHPVSLRSFVSTRALVGVLEYVQGKVTSETVLSTWYDVSIIFADNSVVLGPYFRAACDEDGKNAETCECNLGARKLRVFSLSGLLNGTDPAGEKEITLGSCQIAYTRPASEEKGLSAAAIAGVAVAGVAMIAISILAGLSMMGGKQRDTRYAPKDPSQPYTLVFTDIQSSTSLWARIPDEMGPALDTHHEIIRKLIKKHRGYEVKTIGDAFMIAFESPDDAVDLCESLQKSFFEHDWGTKAIDETYKQLEQEAVEEDAATDKAISCNLPEALYRKMWNGLRVRCGVHTGMGDIKLDEITQGYDYYGNVPNVAARTEAIGNGGQICVTGFAINALAKDRSVTDLGPVDLRGVTDPVVIHQVDGVAGRKFAGLRVDKGLEEDDLMSQTDDDLSSVANSELKSVVGETASMYSSMSMKGDDCNLRDALNTMFGTIDIDVRRSTLGKIGTKWRVAPKSSKKGDKPAECNELIRGISNRIIGVLRSKKKQIHNASIKSVSTRQSAVMSLHMVASNGQRRDSLGTSNTLENDPKLRGMVSPTLLSPSNGMSPPRVLPPNMVMSPTSASKYAVSDVVSQ